MKRWSLMAVLAILLCCGLALAEPEEAEYQEFYDCDGISYILLEDGTAQIQYAEYFDEDVVTLPDALDGIPVTSIDEGGVYTYGVEEIVIPDSITRLDVNPFYESEDLLRVYVSPDHPTLATIDGVLFDKNERRLISYPLGRGESEYVVPEGILSIGDYAFYRSMLRGVELPQTLDSIGDFAFGECISLRRIALPEQLTHIGAEAFYCCEELDEIKLPQGLSSLDDLAFFYCTGLNRILLPDSLVKIGMNPFAGCTGLQEIYASPDHATLAVIDGVLFSKPDKRLVAYPCGLDYNAYEVPDGIQRIDDCAFSDNPNLMSVDLPDTVVSIGDYAFAEDGSLQYIRLSSALTEIGEYAFDQNYSLLEAELPEGLTTIKDGTFCNCSSLTAVKIPESVTSIEGWAFGWCHSLAEVDLSENIVQIDDFAFDGCENLSLNVSRDSCAWQYAIDNYISYTCVD